MATKNVVTGERYMDIGRKLHEIQRQLLQKGGYPHDLDLLESVLQRATEGRFFPDSDNRFSVTCKGESAVRCLKRLDLDNEVELLEEVRGWSAPVPPSHARGPYQAWITAVRLQRQTAWSGIVDLLERRDMHPASLEESCAFLEKNRVLQQDGPILCMDGFVKDGKQVFLAFTGDQRRRFTRTLEPTPDETICPHVCVLAREQIVTIL